MAPRSEPTQVSELLNTALAPLLGEDVDILGVKRLSGGASRETWSFTAASRPLILRRDPPGRPGPEGAMRNEADVIQACSRAGLAVPEVLLCDEGDLLGTAGMVMSAVDGETIPRRILRDEEFVTARTVLGQQVAEFMAGLHNIDPVEVPGVGESDELTNYRVAYTMVGDSSPVFERAFEWLESNRSDPDRTTIVHGDLRMGNVIVDGSGLAAVIDWELMHLGDPIEDLAWFCVKAWRFGSPLGAGGVAEIEDFLGAYERASGRPVDRDRFHWWLVQKTLTWGVIAMGQAFAHLSGAVRSHELAAIGRRVAEQEWDLVELLAPHSAAGALRSSGFAADVEGFLGSVEDPPGLFGRPTAREMLSAVRDFLSNDVVAKTEGRLSYDTRVAANMIAMVERQLAMVDSATLESLGQVDRDSWDGLARAVLVKLAVANPNYI